MFSVELDVCFVPFADISEQHPRTAFCFGNGFLLIVALNVPCQSGGSIFFAITSVSMR